MTRQLKPKKNQLLKFDNINDFEERVNKNFYQLPTRANTMGRYKGKSKLGRKPKMKVVPEWISIVCSQSYIDKEPLPQAFEDVIYGVCNLEYGKIHNPSPYTVMKLLATLQTISTLDVMECLPVVESTAYVYARACMMCIDFLSNGTSEDKIATYINQ